MSKPIKFSEKAFEEFESFKTLFDNPKSTLIPTLYLAQREFGFLSQEVIEYVASLLNLSPAKVMEVASFYTMLNKKPIGRHHVQVCINISCAMLKSRELFNHLKKKLNVENEETTSDRKFTLSGVECLGACDKAPAIQINEIYHYNMTPEKMDQLLKECK